MQHLTLRGNPVGAKPYLRLEVTHLMPSLVSLDGQPVRSGPGTPRGGSEKLARSQRQQQAQSDRPSDPYARFEAVFKAPLFDPPGGPPGTADEADPTLDVDYAPDEAVEWLHTIVGCVAGRPRPPARMPLCDRTATARCYLRCDLVQSIKYNLATFAWLPPAARAPPAV